MTKYLRISSYIRKPFIIHDFATDPVCISLYIGNFLSFFVSTERTEAAVRVLVDTPWQKSFYFNPEATSAWRFCRTSYKTPAVTRKKRFIVHIIYHEFKCRSNGIEVKTKMWRIFLLLPFADFFSLKYTHSKNYYTLSYAHKICLSICTICKLYNCTFLWRIFSD